MNIWNCQGDIALYENQGNLQNNERTFGYIFVNGAIKEIYDRNGEYVGELDNIAGSIRIFVNTQKYKRRNSYNRQDMNGIQPLFLNTIYLEQNNNPVACPQDCRDFTAIDIQNAGCMLSGTR